MNLKKYFDRFDRLHSMIRRKATGSPAELAAKLNLSERAVFEYIRIMREMGAPISFCHSRRTYYYEREVQFNMGFRELTNEEAKGVDAGSVHGGSNILLNF
jgi:predicted DNA-binding transcriptional regulator YafY